MLEMDHGNMPGMEMNQADTRPPACAPEHAAMGHCTAEPEPSKPAMTMDEPAAAPADPDCPPDHAKMGHCPPKASPKNEPTAGVDGTGPAPGDHPATAPPGHGSYRRCPPAPPH